MSENVSLKNIPRVNIKVRELLTMLGAIVVCMGTAILLHFLWDWSAENIFVAVIAAVNESVWEHAKIYAIPFLLFGIAEYYILRPHVRHMIIARTLGTLTLMAGIICLYYIYSGILGYSIMWVDIVIGALSLIAAEIISMRALNNAVRLEGMFPIFAAVLVLIIIMLLCFTASAPHIGLFSDPATGLYGLEKRP